MASSIRGVLAWRLVPEVSDCESRRRRNVASMSAVKYLEMT